MICSGLIFLKKELTPFVIYDNLKNKYAKGTLHSHYAIAPFGSPNTAYAVRSLHHAHPYSATTINLIK